MAHQSGSAAAVDTKKLQASASLKQGGSGVLNVYNHTLATQADHYDEARRRLMANPHIRPMVGASGQMMPWLPPAATMKPASDSLWELGLTTSDMMKKLECIPAMDILYDDEKKEMVLLADVPGYDKKDISVSEDDGALVIKGELSEENETEQRTSHSKCLLKERRSGYFVRRFQLPKNAVENGVTATMDKGVLRVNIKLQDSGAGKKPICIK